jgi:hypothetical protein
MTLKKPKAYQRGGQAEAHAIQVAYSVRNGEVTFRSGKYDHSRELIIDPALIFSTYLISNCAQCGDFVADVAADGTGAYITGSTNASSFPYVAGGPLPTLQSTARTFVVKLDPTGSKVLYATYLDTSQGISVAVDGSGNAYVAGSALLHKVQRASRRRLGRLGAMTLLHACCCRPQRAVFRSLRS